MSGRDVGVRAPGSPSHPGRREFFGQVALVAGGIAVSAALPWPAAAAGAAAAGARPLLADWSIDDQWGASPRYAEPIGFGRRPEATVAAAGSIDVLFHA
jgi:hypothetical protein